MLCDTAVELARDAADGGFVADVGGSEPAGGESADMIVKLKEPLSYALNYFAAFGSHTGNMIMLPKETDNGFDPRSQMIGHGPYELSNVTPSVGYTLKRNAAYYDVNSYPSEQKQDQRTRPCLVRFYQAVYEFDLAGLRW